MTEERFAILGDMSGDKSGDMPDFVREAEEAMPPLKRFPSRRIR